jgi:nucleotide-binding universal stress UspA family protein
LLLLYPILKTINTASQGADKKMQKNPKILLALDGSEQSLIAVNYISRVISKQAKIVLLHVMGEIPETFRDMNVDPYSGKEEYPLDIWKNHQEAKADEFMTKARNILIDSGMAPNAVEIKTKTITAGIARDIRNETQQNYTALVIGRTGVSNIEEISIGSVAAKLIETCGHLSIVVVGQRPQSKKIMIALDGSEGSIRAVARAGALIDPAECEVMFCHVIRPLSIQQLSPRELFKQKHEEDWIAANQRKMVPVIMEARRRLQKARFSEERISSEILTYQKSRAAAIVKAAANGGYDTIALGRRGLTSVGEFSIGRVSRKILQFAFRPALWIIS